MDIHVTISVHVSVCVCVCVGYGYGYCYGYVYARSLPNFGVCFCTFFSRKRVQLGMAIAKVVAARFITGSADDGHPVRASVHARFCAPGLATLHAARSGSSCACGCECACFDCYLLFVVFEIVFSPLLGHTPCCIIRHNLISFCFVAFILLIKKSSTALAVHVACNVSHVACMQPLL